jgi:RHS repeat-associated protein
MATIRGRKIATTTSGHFAPGPTPAVSFVPPTPPAGPVTAPFAYIALSSTATSTSNKLKVGRAPALVQGSVMPIQMPGNLPGQPTGGDIVTHVACAKAEVFTGASQIKAQGKPVACMTDQVRMNVPYRGWFTAQTIGRLIMTDYIRSSDDASARAASGQVILDPISVVSGAVVDEDVDLAIHGLVPMTWRRLYSTQRTTDHTPLGRGGWTHSYHQWMEFEADLLRLRDADGSTLELRGVEPGQALFHRERRLEITPDKRGGATVFSLDDRLRRTFAPLSGGGRAYLREISNSRGDKLLVEYDNERLARIVDTAGRAIEVEHDRDGHISRLSVLPPAKKPGTKRAPLQTVSFAYDEDGALVRVTDALGESSSYAYDEHRRLAKKTLPNGLSFHYVYDPETGRCIRSWGDGGIHAGDIQYDLEQGITRLTGNPEPRIFTWRREDGAVVGISSPDGLFTRAIDLDEDLLPTAIKNGVGDGFSYAYDERGNLTRITDALGRDVELEYEADLLVRRKAGERVTEFAYDHRGMLVSAKYPGGATISLTYDERGRLSTIHGPDGPRSTLIYDEQNNIVEERRPRGAVLRFAYDAMGRPVSFTDPLGRTIRRELDALGRCVALHYPDGGSVRFALDALGRVTREIDASGSTLAYRYAGLRSPVELTGPDGQAWTLVHDTNERLQQVKNARGERFDFRYDRASNPRETRSFDGRITRFTYGRNHRLARVELPDGAWLACRYDAAGRLVAEDSPHGTIEIERSADGRTERYVLHDPAGDVVVEATYDDLGRLVAESQNGKTLRYEYDLHNRCIARHLPTGQVTRYAYDADDHVVGVEHDGYRVELRRDLAGSLAGLAFVPAGIESRRVLDAMGRLTREWVGAGTRVVVDRLYAYEGKKLISMNDARWGAIRYGYDAVGRLVEATSRAGREAFEYDTAGSLQPAGAAWEIAPGNVLRKTERAEYAYDEASRRVREVRRDNGLETHYFWDCRDRLREVLLPDGTRVLMTYDAFGRRVRKEVVDPVRPTAPDTLPEPPQRRTVEYLWDGSCLAAEIDSERGARVFVHVPGTMTPLLQQEGGEIHAVITDHLGAPTELVDQRGELAWSATRSAWGVVREAERRAVRDGRPVEPPFRLLGQHHDEDVGLCYVRHRWFDPAVARFLSPDPLDLAGGPNLFAFNGTPTMHVDPLGLACILFGDPRVDDAIQYVLDNWTRTTPPKINASLYEVYVHGKPDHFVKFLGGDRREPANWQRVEVEEVTNRIRTAGNYNGEDIYLNACHTGATKTGVAQQVSKAFGVRVQAPSDVVWGRGQAVAAENPYTNRPDMSRVGVWHFFSDGRALSHP